MAMQTGNNDTPVRQRNRKETEHIILAAAKSVLAEEGFQKFGVNAVARRAKCDKQLIYRYFGGLEGLADAIGTEVAEQLTDELARLSVPAPTSFAELVQRLTLGFLDLLRNAPLVQRISAWAIAEPSPLVARFVEARSRRLQAWMGQMCHGLTAREGVDVGATNAILIAAVQQMVLSATVSGEFAAMPLRTDADWARLRTALEAVVRAVYGQD